ncbi:MAG: nucleotidyltransferase domain-containing protein [Dissulfurispiraceae bacterium]
MIQDAENIARLLAKAFPVIDAILLYGSVARGDADEWSDIDLVVIGSDPKLTLTDLYKTIADIDERVSLIYYPMTVFRTLYAEHAFFISHLQKETVALYDRHNRLEPISSQPFVAAVHTAEEIKAYRDRLVPYMNPLRFNNNFLFCLSHLYSIGKGIIMRGLTKRGIFEFNREAAFQQFASLNPDLAKEVEIVAKLRPFYRLVTGRQPEPLPFPYQSADRQMQEAVRAIEMLAQRDREPTSPPVAPELFEILIQYAKDIEQGKVELSSAGTISPALTFCENFYAQFFQNRMAQPIENINLKTKEAAIRLRLEVKGNNGPAAIVQLIAWFEKLCDDYSSLLALCCGAGSSDTFFDFHHNYLMTLLERASSWAHTEYFADIEERARASFEELQKALPFLTK